MMLQYEQNLQQTGCTLIAGIDEAGRGPLAGPVVVAGVIMPLDDIIEGINDSKKLSEKKREKLFDQIMAKAIDVQVAILDNEQIDQLNILNATKLGMLQCINGFSKVDHVLIDAVKLDTPIPTTSIIHGDALSYSIAAASIVAKVTRDRQLIELDKLYPQYGFARNKGYGTAEHIAALKECGPCPAHRRSFIRNFCV
ncbi:MAG: ribonuclease HII [Clostridia bacterium]|nr:ribonuclease HII [Clostridia bacterium]